MMYLAYCALTQVIIWLGWLREKLLGCKGVWQTVRHDRTFYASNNERWLCCDCGLEHATYPPHGQEPVERAFRFVPVRIKGYDYRWRTLSGGSSPSFDESGKDAWTGKPKEGLK
jgi:hypothetical protein